MTTPDEATTADETMVRVSNVSKVYRLFANPRVQLLESLGLLRFLPSRRLRDAREFRALDDVSITVRRGERVGLVGRNGAGKTTLLKLITGNFGPTTGEVEVNGEVQALMQMGLGFHPEFTGMENIRAALDYNGLAGDALEAAVEDVIEFVELDDFLEQPMKTYSLGMQARVQFAAATAIRPDILIVDEVLGAGDTYFSAKSAYRMEQVALSGCTLLLVSHSTQQVLQFCDRAVWIHEGKVLMDGDAVDVLNAYEVHLEHASEVLFTGGLATMPTGEDGAGNAEEGAESPLLAQEGEVTLDDGRVVRRAPGNIGVKICRVALKNSEQEEVTELRVGEPFEVEFELLAEVAGEYGLRYLVTFWRDDGVRVARSENPSDRFTCEAGDRRRVRVEFDRPALGPGSFTISWSVYDVLNFSSTVGGRTCRFEVLNKTLPFSVVAPAGVDHWAGVTLPGEWEAESPKEDEDLLGENSDLSKSSEVAAG